MPVTQPTSSVFGGSDLKTLYISSVFLGMNAEQRAAFLFSSRRRHTRYWRDWSQTCALPISNFAGCQTLTKSASPAGAAQLASHPAVLKHITRTIARWNIDQPGTSTRIARVLLLTEPPSIDANEITDKGYVNQRLVLERRKTEVERL